MVYAVDSVQQFCVLSCKTNGANIKISRKIENTIFPFIVIQPNFYCKLKHVFLYISHIPFFTEQINESISNTVLPEVLG
jgi:hypothetical protein